MTLCIGAANRDPAQFADPERFDIGRTPNRHLAFGTGAHQCAGMALARLEGAIAISRFLARFPDYALDGEPVRGGRVRFRGFLSVPCDSRLGRGRTAGVLRRKIAIPTVDFQPNDFCACALILPGGEAQGSERMLRRVALRFRARRTCAAP